MNCNKLSMNCNKLGIKWVNLTPLGPRITPDNILDFYGSHYFPDNSVLFVKYLGGINPHYPDEKISQLYKNSNYLKIFVYDMRRWYIGLKWMIWGMVIGEVVSDCLIVKNQYTYNSFTFYFPRDEFRLPPNPYARSAALACAFIHTCWGKSLPSEIKYKILSFI